MAAKAQKSVEIFYSYAHEDGSLRNALEKQLSTLERQGLISGWHDREISGGREWAGEITEHLNGASVILLLISPDFIASDYCFGVEMTRAMERHNNGEARVIPIMLRPTDCTGTPFEKLQYLPTDGKPVTKWSNRDEAFLDIARGIRKIVEEFCSAQERDTTNSRSQYCDKLHEHWHMLDFKGIMHVDMNRPMSIPLTEVFVLPDVLVGVPEDETIEREGADGSAVDWLDSLEIQAGENWQDILHQRMGRAGRQYVPDGDTTATQYLPSHEALQTREKRIVRRREDLSTVVAKHRRLIILGDPGSGKSTLLRQIMLLLAQGEEAFSAVFPQLAEVSSALPLYIPLAAYAESWLSAAPGERSLKQFLPRYLCEHYLDEYVDLLHQQLEQGNVFVLLDGLDEIPDASLRMQIVRHVETFTQSFPKNRFIITSRIVGYKEAPLAAEYQAYTLADFDEEQIKTFMQRWCPAYERWVKGVTDSHYLQSLATKEAEKMFRVIQRKPGVRKLAVNPLLLTIIALIQRQGIELPGHRVELFDLCAMTLIDTWVKAKGIVTSATFSKNNLIKLLCPLAFWMHEHPAVSAIPEEELIEQIVRQLLARRITRHEDEALKLAEQFLDIVRGKTGILIERGRKRYGFLHLTFEEYFAARELEIREDRDEFITAHLHDARWREVILLTVGCIGILHSNENGVTRVVQKAILHANSPYEKWLHRDLLFAGTCLADDVGLSIECEDDIIKRILYLYISSPYDSLREVIDDTLNQWRDTPIAGKVGKIILSLLQKLGVEVELPMRSPGILSAEARMLEQEVDEYCQRFIEQRMNDTKVFARSFIHTIRPLPDESEDKIQLLINTLSNEDVRDRQIAIRMLGWLGEKSPNVVAALLRHLSDTNQNVRLLAVEVLGELGQEHPEVVDALLQCLSDPYNEVKWAAITTLSQMREKSDEVIAALTGLLSDTNQATKNAAITALGRLGQDNASAIDPLLKLLSGYDVDGKRKAIVAVEGLAQMSSEIIEKLLGLLSDTDKQVRQTTIQSLGRLAKERPELIQVLLSQLADADWQMRQAVVAALGETGNGNAEIIDRLLELLADTDLDVRYVAIFALGKVGKGHLEVLEALRKHLTRPYSLEAQAAIQALGRLEQDTPEVIKALLRLLVDVNPNIRKVAVQALGRLGQNHTEVIEALLKRLSDTHTDVQLATVKALGRLGQERPEIISALLKLLSESNSVDMQYAVVDVLAQKSEHHPEVIEELLKLLSGSQSRLKYAAAKALIPLGRDRSDVLEALSRFVFEVDESNTEPLFPSGISDNKFSERFELFRSILAILPDTSLEKLLATEDFKSDIKDDKQDLTTSLTERSLHVLKAVNCTAPHVIETLLRLLSAADWHIREAAIETLKQVGQGHTEVIEDLLGALADEDISVRIVAIESLGDIGQGHEVVIEALIRLIGDGNWDIRQKAVQALGKIGQGHQEVISVLLGCLSDTDEDVRQAAAQALGQLGDGQPGMVDTLFKCLSDTSEDVRSTATKVLERWGSKQEGRIDLLLERLMNDDIDWELRQGAARALGEIGQGHPEVIEALLKSLSKPYVVEISEAAQALGRLGQGRPEVIDGLLKRLLDFSPRIRFARSDIVKALGQLGQGYPEVIDALLGQLRDTNWSVRQAMAEALGQIGQGNPEVIEALLKLFSDTDWQVRQAAVQALGQLEQGHPQVIEAFLDVLFDSQSGIREQAARALGQLASGDPRVVQALLKIIIRDDYPLPRQAAVSALVALPVDRAALSQQIEEMLQSYEPISSKQIGVDVPVDSLMEVFLKIMG